MIRILCTVRSAGQNLKCKRCSSNAGLDVLSADLSNFKDPKVAVIALVTSHDRMLLIRRGVNPGKGQWALPGGFMDAGEMPQEALVRELYEEVGIQVEVGELLGIFAMVGPVGHTRGYRVSLRRGGGGGQSACANVRR